MPFSHLLLVLSVVVIWGINFIFVKLGLQDMPPLLLCALRFLLASIPALFVVKLPPSSFKIILTYGLFMFALQFSLVFTALNVGMTPGMASLIMQIQVFFSMFIAIFLFKEQPNIIQLIGALIAFSGIGVVAFHFDQDISLLGFLLILGAAATWGIGNLIAKKMQGTNLMAVVIWGSFFACFPMLILSFIFEGPERWLYSYAHWTWIGFSALLYIVYISTWLGYGIWNWLLGRYPVSVVVPFTLLIPVVGMLSSIVFLHEPFQLWKLVAGLLVIAGLCINLLNTRLATLKLRSKIALNDV